MFHKTNLGQFGESLPCDLDGYVPEVNDTPGDFRWDGMDDEWTLEEWASFVTDAVRETREAERALDRWRAA